MTDFTHHTPRLLSDADAAADLAGVARPSLTSVGTEDALKVANLLPAFEIAGLGKGVAADACNMLRALVSERDALAVRVRELEADAHRLDWMEKNGGQHTVCVSGRWYVRKDYREPHVRAGSLRSAIDAALTTTPESKP